jgi:hypothetical protein
MFQHAIYALTRGYVEEALSNFTGYYCGPL